MGTDPGPRRVGERVDVADGNVFVSDLRFENEFDACVARGFRMVKIVRASAEIGDRAR